ncbi:MAG: hypothetical protein ACLR4Z_05185 [Butyricicoccaceae bacterium]
MVPIAIALELVFVGRLAMKVAFRLVNPREAGQTQIMLAISAASVWIMCPCMSFLRPCCSSDSHNVAVPRHLDTDYRHEFPDGAPAPVFLCRPDYAPHLRRAVPRENAAPAPQTERG